MLQHLLTWSGALYVAWLAVLWSWACVLWFVDWVWRR